MQSALKDIILETTEASEILHIEKIQDLWNDYGQVLRLTLDTHHEPSIIIKHVRFARNNQHPRGWSSDISHERKIKSYQVECQWYEHYTHRCITLCPMPTALKILASNNETVLILTDMKQQGFPTVRKSVNLHQAKNCLRWLANFHAFFMQEKKGSLWSEGSYWHLATRTEELDALNDTTLKEAAAIIDSKLSHSPYQTLIHGDAKLANFCFSDDTDDVAALDFQYTGHGCGMKDVAYFIGSCFNASESIDLETSLLTCYFEQLHQVLAQYHPHLNADAIEQNWRPLYHFACADFQRFLKAWCPNHWKTNQYSEAITTRVLKQLKSERLI